MKTLEIINSSKDVSDKEANDLALEVLSEVGKVNKSISLKALLELGYSRTDGVSFSKTVSKKTSVFICDVYSICDDSDKQNIADLVRELESKVAIELADILISMTENENLKYSLQDSAAYAGT